MHVNNCCRKLIKKYNYNISILISDIEHTYTLTFNTRVLAYINQL